MRPSILRILAPVWLIVLAGGFLANLPYNIGVVVIAILTLAAVDGLFMYFGPNSVYADIRSAIAEFLRGLWNRYRGWREGRNKRTVLTIPHPVPTPPTQRPTTVQPSPQIVVPTIPVPEPAKAAGQISERPVVKNNLPLTQMRPSDLPLLKAVGEGGEAVVYRMRDPKTAIKVFRKPEDQYYAGDSPDQKAAREGAATRLRAYPRKFQAFPVWLGSRVVAPIGVVQLDPKYPVGGYLMPFVDNAKMLTKYTDPDWKRQNNVKLEDIAQIFLDLYDSVSEVHACGVLIGDFKPDNVLVRQSDLAAFIVDAESAGLGNDFPCRTFSENYVDPQLCDPNLDYQVLVKPYRRSSDWYAWTVMLFQALTNLNPWDGVYKAPPGKSPVLPTQRALKGISVFNKNVKIPNFTATIQHLPQELQAFFFRTFESGLRERPSREMIEKLLSPNKRRKFDPIQHTCWKKYGVAVNSTQNPTTLNLKPFYEGSGEVLAAMTWNRKPVFLVKEGIEIKREDGTVLVEDTNHEYNHFRVDATALLMGKDNHNHPNMVYDGPFYRIAPEEQAVRVRHVDPNPDGNPNIGIQGGKLLWLERGALRIQDQKEPLVRFDDAANLFVGPVFSLVVILNNGILTDLFFQKGTTVARLISLPPIMGEIKHLQCNFSRTTAWLIFTAEWNGVLNRYVLVFDEQGNLVSLGTIPAADNQWHSPETLKAAFEGTTAGIMSRGILALTDKELVRVECDGNKLVVRSSNPWTAGGKVTHLLETHAGPMVGLRKPVTNQPASPQAVAQTVAQ